MSTTFDTNHSLVKVHETVSDIKFSELMCPCAGLNNETQQKNDDSIMNHPLLDLMCLHYTYSSATKIGSI